ncbi:hypothetical protein [Sulfitobacter sp. M22]|jgi:hypothetical protein|uniref:hypothetical protein n=1 Tax=Sulfitobacter sp. M22 TaxID=2675332 RepID=UPI001F42E17F|nr:hypothetical protein [Sulfitobacter sp. M22]MCF7728710.1 hypothetical protein [Sulfitobacter sp. M22]
MNGVLFKMYFAIIGAVVAVSVGILAYAEVSGENLRHAYYANFGFRCGNALYFFDWGGGEAGFNAYANEVAQYCNLDHDPRF